MAIRRSCAKMVSLALLVINGLVAQDIGPPPKSETAPLWAPLTFLLGEWVGVGAGAPGEGSGAFSFQWDLQRKILIRRNRADYPMTKDRPAFSHEDLMIIYPDPSAERARAIYFDNEGHVINYAIHVMGDQNSIEFLSDPAPSAPRFRLTYTKTGTDTLALKFEIAPPGKPNSFAKYIEAAARRK